MGKESKVDRNKYIVLQGWMITDLELKGAELIIYACIYGFTQAENQIFNGSLQYLADWTNSTKRQVMRCLKSLTDKGYISKNTKKTHGITLCEYYANTPKRGGDKMSPLVTKCQGGSDKMSPGGGDKMSPNNIDIDNIYNNLDKEKINKKESKHKYGEYNNVLLSDVEYQKLIEEFPIDYNERIEKLSEYIAATGKKYKDFLATIRMWAKREQKNKITSNNATPIRDGSEYSEYD